MRLYSFMLQKNTHTVTSFKGEVCHFSVTSVPKGITKIDSFQTICPPLFKRESPPHTHKSSNLCFNQALRCFSYIGVGNVFKMFL